jgi:hypothetical protein
LTVALRWDLQAERLRSQGAAVGCCEAVEEARRFAYDGLAGKEISVQSLFREHRNIENQNANADARQPLIQNNL